MRLSILSSLSSFVKLSLSALPLGLLILGAPASMGASETPLPDGMTMPSSEALAKELGQEAQEFKQSVDDFATALGQGNQSQALKRLCARDEQSCQLIKDFQNQAADAKGERKRARTKGKFRINENKLAEAQRADFHLLIGSLKVADEYKLFSLAEKALQVPGCPRNLSAALAIKTEEYFPFPKARTLSKDLFNHARQCLSEDSVVYERLFLRQGLYALYEGDKARAKDMLTLAKKATVNAERYRVLYWLGRMQHDAGTKPSDNQDWAELLRDFPLSYYAIDAADAQGRDPMEMITQRRVGGLKRTVADDPELNRMIRWLEALYIYKKPGAVAKWASWIVRANENDLDVDVIQYLSTLKVAAGLYRSNISMLFSYFKKNPKALNGEGLKLLYPRPYYSLIEEASRGKVDTFLVMGLVRQESAFDSQAISRVKAKGLMQIIPGTARHLASQGHKKLLNEKENTKMGVKYLMQLSGRFDGSAELVLAAYNAGPLKVDEWMRRNPERKSNMLLWNDLIPYMETRDYVVSILRNNYLYTRLYGAPQENTENLFQSALVHKLLVSAAPKTAAAK